MVGQEIKTITTFVRDYFNDHPEEELSPNIVYKALSVKYRKIQIRYSSINSAMNRLCLQGKIFRTFRGKYVLKLPLADGQLTIDDIKESEEKNI